MYNLQMIRKWALIQHLPDVAQRNVISGNDEDGVRVIELAVDTLIKGNIIGAEFQECLLKIVMVTHLVTPSAVYALALIKAGLPALQLLVVQQHLKLIILLITAKMG